MADSAGYDFTCGAIMVTSSKEEYDKLFEQYVEICNQALEKNKSHFPYKQIWHAAQSMMADKGVALEVFDDRPKACYTLTLKDDHIDVQSDEDDAKNPWHVNVSYLEKVVNNPQEYIDHPAKIDWDWLKSRLHLI